MLLDEFVATSLKCAMGSTSGSDEAFGAGLILLFLFADDGVVVADLRLVECCFFVLMSRGCAVCFLIELRTFLWCEASEAVSNFMIRSCISFATLLILLYSYCTVRKPPQKGL